jgi:hypothetical protein
MSSAAGLLLIAGVVNVGQAASEVQLVLQGAAANGSDLAFSSSNTSSANCTKLVFLLQLSGTSSKPGSFTGHILFPQHGLYAPLPQPLMVVVPLLLSVTSSRINVSADESSFAVGVQLNLPAAAHGVTVRLQLTDVAARVGVSFCAVSCKSQHLQQGTLKFAAVSTANLQ